LAQEEEGLQMIDLSESEKKHLARYKTQVARVEKGLMWGDHPGPYTDKEKAGEIARIKALIARVEARNA
jgi:hypothetical protein